MAAGSNQRQPKRGRRTGTATAKEGCLRPGKTSHLSCALAGVFEIWARYKMYRPLSLANVREAVGYLGGLFAQATMGQGCPVHVLTFLEWLGIARGGTWRGSPMGCG